MSFTVIKGTFHVTGYSPDGDSIRFMAENSASWNLLGGRKVRLNARQHAQLRIEAIDTLETHYKKQHQPEKLATAATKYLFKRLGIKNVVWNANMSRIRSADDGVTGYIMARKTDRYGRPVAFLYAGSQSFKDGEQIYLKTGLVKKSVNYKVLSKGLAYPTFYDGIFYDLRELFARRVVKAREAGLGVWASDKTNKYFELQGVADITEKHVIFPKLFRRITAYLQEHDRFDPQEFLNWLEKKPEKVLIMNLLHFTHFDNLIAVSDKGKIKLTEKPENLLFLS